MSFVCVQVNSTIVKSFPCLWHSFDAEGPLSRPFRVQLTFFGTSMLTRQFAVSILSVRGVCEENSLKRLIEYVALKEEILDLSPSYLG